MFAQMNGIRSTIHMLNTAHHVNTVKILRKRSCHFMKGFPKWKLSPESNSWTTWCRSESLGRNCMRRFLSLSESCVFQTCQKFHKRQFRNTPRQKYIYIFQLKIIENHRNKIVTSYESTSLKLSKPKISWGMASTSAKTLCPLWAKLANGLICLQLMPICSRLATTLWWLPSHSTETWDFMVKSLRASPKFFFLVLYCSGES